MAVINLRVMGRATQGVRLINIREGDSIASVARVEIDEEAEQIPETTADNSTENDIVDENDIETPPQD